MSGCTSVNPSATPRPVADIESLADRLTVKQIIALGALLVGQSIREVAGAAAVDRRTVTRWITSDLAFRTVYTAWRQEMRESTRAKLLNIAEAAVAVIEMAVEKGDTQIAMSLLVELELFNPASA